ncbi:MAG: amidohydrolase family protein [Pseudomonadales bacterium]
MRTIKHLLSTVLMLATAGAAAQPTAIVNVNVIAMDAERVDAAQTVIVDDGRIIALGNTTATSVPKNAIRINGEGHYLIPGLAEMHAHIPSGSPEFTERVLTLFVANGITTIRGMLGHPSHLALRDKTASGTVLGPRIVTSGPSFNGRSVHSPNQAVSLVRAQRAAGYDFLKLHPGLERDEFDAIAKTANKLGIPFAGHVSLAVGLPRALAAKQATIDHFDGYMQALVRDGTKFTEEEQEFFGLALAIYVDENKLAELAQQTAKAGVWNVPTQSFLENMASSTSADTLQKRPEMRYMPADTVANWAKRKQRLLDDVRFNAAAAQKTLQIRRQLIKALHEAGAGLLLGSDSPQVFNVPGFATHKELAIMVNSGLTPFEALQTGTTNPARFFGAAEQYGKIAVDQAADMLLLRANPLVDILNTSQIAAVMLAGKWLPREKLDQLLAQYADPQ